MMAIGVGCSALCAPLAFTWVYETYGLLAFLQVYCASGVAVPLVALVMPESVRPGLHARGRTNPLRSLKMLCKNSEHDSQLEDGRSSLGVLRVLVAVIFLLYVVKQGFAVALGLFAQQRLGFSTGDAALLQTIYAVFQITIQLSVGFILKVLSKRVAIGVGVMMGIFAGAILSFPGIPPQMLYVANSALAIAAMAYVIAVSMAAEVAPPGKTGEAVMVLNVAMSMTAGLGPILFGLVVQGFGKTNYPNGAFLSLMFIVVISLFFVPCLPSDALLAGPRVKAEASVTDSVLDAEALPLEGGSTIIVDEGS